MLNIDIFIFIEEYLFQSGLVPTSIIQDLANNIGNFGRSADSDMRISDIINQIKRVELEQKAGNDGRAKM